MKRPSRLVILALFFSVLFMPGRIAIVAFVFIVLLVLSVIAYVKRKSRAGLVVVTLLVLFTGFHLFSMVDQFKLRKFIVENSPIDVSRIAEGGYEGEARGLRGPIRVRVEVRGGRIEDVRVLEHQEAISALYGLREQVLEAGDINIKLVPATVHGSPEATIGFKNAVLDALWKGYPGRPEPKPWSKLTFWMTKHHFNRITLNSLAIIFVMILVFDYSLQPVIAEGTGQSLNCYNCQICVGACPVKIVDGEPYPMTMVLAARLGDYEKVERLAGYCVACSKCAGKCPVSTDGKKNINTETLKIINN